MTKRRDKFRPNLDLAPSLSQNVLDDLSDTLGILAHSPQREVERYKIQYLRTMVFEKFLDPDPAKAVERHSAAIEKWRRVELRNAKTSVRLFFSDNPDFGWGVTWERVLSVARKNILRVMGEVPDLEVLYGTFTSGASTGFRKGPGSIADKFMEGADATPTARRRFEEIFSACDTWRFYREGWKSAFGGLHQVEEVQGGTLFTVPKTNEIDRCAVKEPDLNMFLQKGVGFFLRRRLKRCLGLDLTDQTQNQRLAKEGSTYGHLATLDLSSASDTISRELVRQLVPSAWFDLLDDIRSQSVYYDGDWIELEMFSSMGNAFTFELETLIFWALSNAVCYLTGSKGRISVYGDDIIVPSSAAGLLQKVLQFSGFKVNPKKSFWTGYFRESCGKHWYRGCDVTPFFVRAKLVHQEDLVHLLNAVRKWSTLGDDHIWLSTSLEAFWFRWKDAVNPAFFGGRDLERKDALVTVHPPRKRMYWVTRERAQYSLGAYLQWLRVADGRHGEITDPIVTSKVTIVTRNCVVRRSSAARNFEHPIWTRESLEWIQNA